MEILTCKDVLCNGEERKDVNSSDALVLSLRDCGQVDLMYMAKITNKAPEDIIKELKGSIFLNPAKFDGNILQGWETKDEYLSGNLLEKWGVAKEAAKKDPRFNENLEAIKNVKKKIVPFEEIYITLGTPWVPARLICQFLIYLLDIHIRSSSRFYYQQNINTFVLHDEQNSVWKINQHFIKCFANNVKITKTYGTDKIDAVTIVEHTLNMKSIRIKTKVKDFKTHKEKSVLDEEETLLAIKKQEEIIAVFREWLKRDASIQEELKNIYNKKFVSITKRSYDGSFLKFEGLNPGIKLFDYQKNAVARILLSPNTLLSHDVGAGKTYIMITAGMELKRIGISKKNVYVVPNGLLHQWRDMFIKLYQNANIFVVEPNDFKKDKKLETLKRIRDEDFDAIIMPYSVFDRIEFSSKQKAKYIQEEIERLENTGLWAKRIEKIRNLREERANLIDESENLDDNEIYFDELHINTLFVDEAQNYKNVPLNTKRLIRGINNVGSKKCVNMMKKVRLIQSENKGRGIVFATATPITNSLSDLFVMQKYLQNELLAQLGISDFNAWLANFAEIVTDAEIDVDTTKYRMVERFSKFHNLPELTTIFSLVADFHEVDKKDIPQFEGYTDCVIESTEAFDKYLVEISKRADIVRAHKISVKQDNMLKITTDARKAALDLRLVDEFTDTQATKAYFCAKNVYEIYRANYQLNKTQVIFCDTSVPKRQFNIYDELKNLLVLFGVHADEIAFVHDADSPQKRKKLFKDINIAKVRIIIGSTWKLGTGANIQEKLVALHHIDIPWRPSDMAQREGRILRFGNTNPEIKIFRYVTEKSFDAYSWQLLEIKEKVIRDILSGMISERNQDDVGEQVLSYAEVKSLAVGDALMKKKCELENSLAKLYILRKKQNEQKEKMREKILAYPKEKEELQGKISRGMEDLKFVNENKFEYSKEDKTLMRQKILEKLSVVDFLEEEILKYRGFKVCKPFAFNLEKPQLVLKRAGNYVLDIELKSGILIRIDNLLHNLENKIIEYENEMRALNLQKETMLNELNKPDELEWQIITLEQEFKNICEQMGI